jgi:D-alanyl-D-alanine carboxypeptidase (penicillin-binding protein 5/6)
MTPLPRPALALLARLAFALPLLALALLAARPAAALETEATTAILVDGDSGAVLFEKNADQRIPPASMTKLMTAYLIFERLKDKRLAMEDLLTVSEKAWRMEGSKMWIEVGEKVRVEDLLRGLIIQSGNDAAVAFAEALSGSEQAFAEEMNRKATEIGLTDSNFTNASGWPAPDQYMTARDLATLGLRLIHDFPEYYHFYSETEFTWANIKQPNRNPLLYRNIGADGLKTGHTAEAGYCLIGTAVQNGKRLLLIITGMSSEKSRAEEGERLLAWGFREFSSYKLFSAGEVLDTAPVFMGAADSVPLVMPRDVELQMLRSARADMKVTLRYQSPLVAPIAQGQEVAVVTVEAPGLRPLDIPVVAGQAVEEMGLLGRMMEGVKSLL